MRYRITSVAFVLALAVAGRAYGQDSCVATCDSCAARCNQCCGKCDGCTGSCSACEDNSCVADDSCCDAGDNSCCGECNHGCCGSFLDCLCQDDGCAYYSCKPKLFGFIVPTDTRFLNFISPMTNPVYFEDPRTLTEARVIFLNHWLPQNLGGSDVQLLAVQARAAITKRLSIIATKDGYIFSGGDGLPINGWANINLGLKYNLYADAQSQRLLSVGTRFELVNGSEWRCSISAPACLTSLPPAACNSAHIRISYRPLDSDCQPTRTCRTISSTGRSTWTVDCPRRPCMACWK